MFKSEGYFDVKVIEAFVGEPKFPAGKGRNDQNGNNRGEAIQVWCDIILKVADADHNSDYWRGEISNRTGTGNYADKTQTDMTIESLRKIGFAVNDFNELYAQIDDNGNLPRLVGLEASVKVECSVSTGTDGKTREYFNVKYLNAPGGGGIRRFNKAAFNSSLQGGGFRDQQPAQQAQAYPTQQPAQQTPYMAQSAPVTQQPPPVQQPQSYPAPAQQPHSTPQPTQAPQGAPQVQPGGFPGGNPY